MTREFKVADVGDLAPGEGKEVLAGEQVVALYNVDGRFFALDGVCPHAGGPLAEGVLRGTVVTCPWHGWQFDVTNGKNCLNPRIMHGCFPVRVEGNGIFVEVPGT
jgi:nitrite reductase (NADH) small subunit